MSVMTVLIDLSSGSSEPHTKGVTGLARDANAPGFTDNRVRNADGYVDLAPRKLIPDLLGGGDSVHEDYPISDASKTNAGGEANVPRQVRGQKADTLTSAHDARTTFDVAVANFKDTLDDNEDVAAWDGSANPTTTQPANPFAARYPYNHARITESGHLFEADDTPGAERIKESHRTGTYYEVFPDGSRVTKIVGDDFTVIVRNEQVNIKGSAVVTVEGDCNLLTKGNFTHQVDGDYNLVVKGDFIEHIAGDVSQDHHANYHHNIGVPIDASKPITTRGNKGGSAKVVVNGDNILQVKGAMSEVVGDPDLYDATGRTSVKQSITFGDEKNQIIGGFKYEEIAKNATQLVGGAHTLNVIGNKKEYVGGLSVSRSDGKTEITGETVDLNPLVPIDG